MAENADLQALARELRELADPWNGMFALTRQESRSICDAMRRAADAMEAKWAAEREALAMELSGADVENWGRMSEYAKNGARGEANRLLASGVLVRVPTREELIAVLGGWDFLSAEIRGELADNVLALMAVRDG